MAESETEAAETDPHTSPSPANQPQTTTLAKDASSGEEKDSHAQIKQSKEPQIDEFGLPIKPVQQRDGESSEAVSKESSKESFKESSDLNAGPQSAAEGSRASDLKESLPKKRSYKSAAKADVANAIESQGEDSSTRAVPRPTSPSHKPTISSVSKLSTTNEVLHGDTGAVSEWSHQALAPRTGDTDEKKREDEWQSMPAYAPYDLYDDDGKLLAREAPDSDEEANAYHGLGGAGKGYTRVQNDEDAQSATSMDENTGYLFKQTGTDLTTEDEEQRDPLAQLQATKSLLTEGQRIAYVGLARLAMAEMVNEAEKMNTTRSTKKLIAMSAESTKMWGQKMMVRLYKHMDIESAEQIMIEQLAEHGVLPSDLTPALMQNARVKNPMAEEAKTPKLDEERRDSTASSLKSPDPEKHKTASGESSPEPGPPKYSETETPPPYKEDLESNDGDIMPKAQAASQLGTEKDIDIDIRWTILCDLFLVLLSDSIYDARSRTLLERVAQNLEVTWLDICKFEKRVIDALEMQEEANKETWDEAEHLENRRKRALRRRYMMMGLATVGGSLVIGLSAGLLAPVIGAGLAAGFSTIGVAGTSGFLAGAGGAAIITSTGVLTGGTIAVRASSRRTGAVGTFEYRPLHNNKKVNLIVTVSGWMSGKVDDVRLPFSTVDPVMGDIYSLLWEPEMLQSMGQTINILANEALSQTIQQVLGSTILVALMSALQLPIVLTKLSYLIDNPWTVSMARANAAGLILADSLIDRNLGMRPITLVGFSLGARMIFAALRELAKRGAFGIIQNVYLFGSPIVANKDEYLRVRTVVSGRFVNGYASNDWILGYLFRATSGGIMRVAGLAKVEQIPGLENVDVTKFVNGHMAYRAAMPKLLQEVGWEVESLEFSEIEDPDPENHEQRQRELIQELEDARKEAEDKSLKKRFNFFSRAKEKKTEKKGWETYDERSKENGADEFSTAAAEGQGANVLFDIEAIKRELESEAIVVRQLESTMPPMKINSNGPTKVDLDEAASSPHGNLRSTKSYDETMAYRLKSDEGASHVSLPSEKNIDGGKDNPFNKGYDEYNLSAEAINANHKGSPSPRPSPSPRREAFDPKEVGTPPPPQQQQSRPSLSTTMSSPTTTAGFDTVDHNAWVDEDDPGFGKEQEVKLTF